MDWRTRCCTWDQLWAWHLEHLFTVYTGDDFAWIVSKKQKPKHRAFVFVFVFLRSIDQHIVWILVQNNDSELPPKQYLLLLLTAHCSQNLLAPSPSDWFVECKWHTNTEHCSLHMKSSPIPLKRGAGVCEKDLYKVTFLTLLFVHLAILDH